MDALEVQGDLRQEERDRPVRKKERELGPIIANLDGTAQIRTRMWLSNQDGEKIAPINRVRGASISMSVSNLTTWNLSLEVDRGLTYSFAHERVPFNPFHDWIKVELEVWMGNEWKAYPKGLYKFDQKGGSHLGTHSTWSLEGYSPEFMLLTDGPEKTFKIKEGEKLLRALQDVCVDELHFKPSRLNFPMSDDVKLDKTLVFDPNQDSETEGNWMAMFTAALIGNGFTKPYADGDGRLRVSKLKSMENREPAIKYGWGLDAEPILIEGIEDTYDTANFCNRVVVTGMDPKKKPAIAATAKSKESRRELGRWVTTKIKQKAIKDKATARDIANAYLKRYMMYTRIITYQTPPDPERGIREFHEIVMDAEGLPNVNGIFRNMHWEQEIYPNPKAMNFTSVMRVKP